MDFSITLGGRRPGPWSEIRRHSLQRFLAKPPGAGTKAPWPLLLFLHGAGERYSAALCHRPSLCYLDSSIHDTFDSLGP